MLTTQRLSISLIVCSCVGFIVAGCTQQTAVNVVAKETSDSTATSQQNFTKTNAIRLGYQKGGIISISRQRGELKQELKQQNFLVEWSGPFDRCATLLQALNGNRADIGGCSVTQRLKFLLAHRPGFVSPTLAARKLATLDHFSQGKVAVHIITGSSDAEQHRDGDWLDHDTRYRRTDEYLDIMRQVWTSAEPFDYEGEFYRVKNAFSNVKPQQKPHMPIYFGGASGAAVAVGAKYSDVYAMWEEPLAAIRQRISLHRKVSIVLITRLIYGRN